MPISRALIDQVGAGHIPSLQYYISDQIIMVKETRDVRTMITADGILEFTEDSALERITINALTLGAVIRVG